MSGDRKDVQKIGFNDIFQKYHNLNIENIFDFSDEILNVLKEKQKPIDEFLNQFMNYLKELIKQNLQDDSSYLKIKNDIKIINEAIKHSNANMSDKIVLETLVLRLLRGY